MNRTGFLAGTHDVYKGVHTGLKLNLGCIKAAGLNGSDQWQFSKGAISGQNYQQAGLPFQILLYGQWSWPILTRTCLAGGCGRHHWLSDQMESGKTTRPTLRFLLPQIRAVEGRSPSCEARRRQLAADRAAGQLPKEGVHCPSQRAQEVKRDDCVGRGMSHGAATQAS